MASPGQDRLRCALIYLPEVIVKSGPNVCHVFLKRSKKEFAMEPKEIIRRIGDEIRSGDPDSPVNQGVQPVIRARAGVVDA